MAGRPRFIVHEGSPIIDDRDYGVHSSVATTSLSDGARAADNSRPATNNFSSIASAANNTSTNSKPYKLSTLSLASTLTSEKRSAKRTSTNSKLETRLVVGGDLNEDVDLDMMMMDEDEHNQHNQQGSNRDDYRGSGHAHDGQQQQYNMGHSTFPAAHHQQQMHPTNECYNNGDSFVPTNPIHHHAPASNPPPPIYHMPPPSTAPLVVLDAANIAYNYSESLNPCQQNQRRQPDPRGIRLAIEYFLKHSCRVQAVVPISWYQLKPRPTDHHHLKNRSRGDSDAKMVTEEVEELRNLRQQGFLVACPPGDDDDAYALALARREEDRLMEQQGMHQDESMGMEDDTSSQHLPKSVLGGYVVSNDFFQDAIRRDEKKLQRHHHHPLNMRPVSLKSWLKKNRISYSFANVGTADVDGEIRLEFLPNPRNDLIEA
eukprot:CAMPEP_0201938290 /NCGR_PEP_ID=MMETSP0903-20130614/41146_1 /ASSEMBLY_ACC=CAM_ASM_000552 /TAXON_ID=420261 /ORGANISM="Thalassiosira antarctica, Strain CCMP982" /LENGTH=429 /DNA_ID=CAMNT_0048479523 /DNA_START=97 /DNA_END=1383 /DNA_ORIENTATION=+